MVALKYNECQVVTLLGIDLEIFNSVELKISGHQIVDTPCSARDRQSVRFPDAKRCFAYGHSFFAALKICDPTGNRTQLTALKRRCPNR